MHETLTLKSQRPSAPSLPFHQSVSKWAICTIFFVINFWWLIHGETRLLIAALSVASLGIITSRSRNLGICLTFAYLALMGDLRRIVSLFLGFPRFDPLLVVAPIMGVALSLPVFARLRFSNVLSKGVAALMMLMILEVFNPKQGGIVVGVTGALFYLVPILWFWIGRQFGTPQLGNQLLSSVILPLGLLAAVLGLGQTFVGFFPWEQAWIDSGALNLSVGNAVRAFGFSISPAGYCCLLIVAAVIAVSRLASRNKLWILALPLLLCALVLASGRTAILRLVIGVAVIWGLRTARTNHFALRLALPLASLLLVVYLTANHFSEDTRSNAGGTQSLIAHQTAGLSHPFDPKHSTAGLHLMYFGSGLINGLKNPLGFGLGSTTAAATKLGPTTAGDMSSAFATELDFTDMFEALGAVGGLTYLFIVILCLRSALHFMIKVDRSLGLMILGILAANIGGFLLSGEYFMSSFLWFLIGVTARLPAGPTNPWRQASLTGFSLEARTT